MEKVKPIAEYIFEVRYKPNAKVLDSRGSWAEAISSEMGLPHWQIQENRVDIFDEEQNFRCFVAFRNAGCIIRNPATDKYFSDQVLKFIKKLGSLEDFPQNIHTERVGVRSKTLFPFTGSFDDLLKRYTERYLKLTSEASSIFKASIVDIGLSLNLRDQLGNLNTASGPMADTQAREVFGWEEDDRFAKTSLFCDFDYFVKQPKTMTSAEISKLVSSFCSESVKKQNQLRDLLFGL